MSNEYGWTLQLTFNDHTYLFEWFEYFHEGTSHGYWARVTDMNTQEELHHTDEAKQVISAATALRQEQIRNQSKHRTYAPDELKKLILAYIERAYEGEYLGQYNNSSTFYVQEVAGLLDLPMNYVSKIVQELIVEERIGLTGNIFIPYEQYEDNFKIHEKRTGHKRLTSSDWGYWACSYCGNSGDPEDLETGDPKKVPCKRKK